MAGKSEQGGLSIHPRNWPNGNGKVVNTCAAPKPGTKQRVIAALQQHLLRHPNDKQSETHLRKLGGEPLEADLAAAA
jgi:hypothetical protein